MLIREGLALGFKELDDFTRFLTMGAYGTKAIKVDLEQRGHTVVELERYAMANKVWATKVKRVRVPDLLCVRCGRRFESKSKSKLELKLSHSGKAGREWFAGGMRPDDVFAFIRVRLSGDADVDVGRPIYVTRDALHDAEADLKDGVRKAIADGSEADVSWPIAVPSYSGLVLSTSGDTVEVVSDAGRPATIRQETKRWHAFYSYLSSGDAFVAEATAVAGCVAPAQVDCAGDAWDWRADLASEDRVDKFCAVKSCTVQVLDARDRAVVEGIAQNAADWRIRLEAAGVLLRRAGSEEALALLVDAACGDPDGEGAMAAMEAVFVLSEAGGDAAALALAQVAEVESGAAEEVRAAAAWGLGTGAGPSPDLLVQSVVDASDLVALHASSAMPMPLAQSVAGQLVTWLRDGDDRQMAASAALLARGKRVNDLLGVANASGTRGSLFALRYLGDLSEEEVRAANPSPDLLGVLLPMWVQHDDWLRSTENFLAMGALESQQVRF